MYLCRSVIVDLRNNIGLWLWVPGRAPLARDDTGEMKAIYRPFFFRHSAKSVNVCGSVAG
jgi:hypothetical protein